MFLIFDLSVILWFVVCILIRLQMHFNISQPIKSVSEKGSALF